MKFDGIALVNWAGNHSINYNNSINSSTKQTFLFWLKRIVDWWLMSCWWPPHNCCAIALLLHQFALLFASFITPQSNSRSSWWSRAHSLLHSLQSNKLKIYFLLVLSGLAPPPLLFHSLKMNEAAMGPLPFHFNQSSISFLILKEKWNVIDEMNWAGHAVSIAIPFIIPFKNSKFFHSMNMQQLYWRQITVIILF